MIICNAAKTQCDVVIPDRLTVSDSSMEKIAAQLESDEPATAELKDLMSDD